MTARGSLIAVFAFASLTACASGGAEPATTSASPEAPAAAATDLATVPAEQAAATIADPPDGLVILDVRTPDEFAEGHIAGATMLDFYEPSFADDLAALDPTVPYVLYCRSGNRSGQALAMMEQLGFGSVQNVDGGILAWQAAGLPVTPG